MATLTTKRRKKIPTRQFALPDEKKYPIHDAAHARNALARASAAKNSGKLSASKYAQVKKRATAALNKFNKKK